MKTRIDKIFACALVCLAAALMFASAARADDVENVLRRLPPKNADQNTDRDKEVLSAPDAAPLAGQRATVEPFKLNDVTIEGATAISAEEFRPIYEPYLTRTVDAADLAKIADGITQKYRAAGYFLSRAVIPAQDAAGGVLRVEIIEGYIAEVEIEGALEKELAPYTGALTAERPARLSTLEGALLAISDIPGVRVASSRMAPIGEDQTKHKLIFVAEQDRFDGLLYADNRGAPAAGEMQTYARAGAASLLAFGDKLSLGALLTPDQIGELWLGEVTYTGKIGTDGLGFLLSASLTRNDQDPPGDTTVSQGERFFAQLTQPLIREREESWWLHFDIEKRHIRSEVLSALQYEDDLFVADVATTYRRTILRGTFSAYAELSHGFERNDAEKPHSRSDADGRFTKASLQVSYARPLGGGFSAQIETAAQFADGPLLSSEEFAVGGGRIGRAYDYGEITGEDGVSGALELRYGADRPFDWLSAYQVYGFYDAGIVWNRNSPGDGEQALTSAGAGFRMHFPIGFSLSYEAAKPLTRTPAVTGDRDLRHFFSLTVPL